jgi:hypothetical protein
MSSGSTAVVVAAETRVCVADKTSKKKNKAKKKKKCAPLVRWEAADIGIASVEGARQVDIGKEDDAEWRDMRADHLKSLALLHAAMFSDAYTPITADMLDRALDRHLVPVNEPPNSPYDA